MTSKSFLPGALAAGLLWAGGALLAPVWAQTSADPPAAPPARSNAFDDPFGPATSGLPGCPEPAGPLWTAEEARREAHWRAERGTSCYLSGRCRLPNAYRYDAEIFPRAVRYLRQDGRFADTSVWLVLQRRWIFVQGCVRSPEQGAALEAALRLIDDVEAVVGQWQVGTTGIPPYEVRNPQEKP